MKKKRKHDFKNNKFKTWYTSLSYNKKIFYISMVGILLTAMEFYFIILPYFVARDPFFNFIFSATENAFVIESAENINIEQVNWFLPGYTQISIPNEHKITFIDINESTNKLSRKKILEYLKKQINNENKNISSDQVEYYIKCYDQAIISNSLSSVVEIDYKYRGEQKSKHIKKFLYLENIFSTDPRILDIININNPEIQRQFFDFSWTKNYFNGSIRFKWNLLNNKELSFVIKDGKDCDKKITGIDMKFENSMDFSNQ
jgi:hypothetical protein